MNTNMSKRPSILKISSAIKSYSAYLSIPKYRHLSSSYKNDSETQNSCAGIILDGSFH